MDPHPIPVRNLVAACDLVLQRAQRISSFICHPLISILQLQGALIGVLLAAAWSWAAVVRLGELRRQQAACVAPTQQPSCSAPGSTPEPPSSDLEKASGLPLPPATVILPVTGCSANSQANWLAALGLRYPAELQFLFVVRSKADAAHDAVLALLAGDDSLRQVPQHKARVVVAGPATSCSQKLHNILGGLAAAAPGSKYVLCLDDDIQVHPSFMERTVQQLQADPRLFMATGYPFDVPAPGSSLLTYCVLAYHLPLLTAFSTRQRIQFVWGGCMVLPLGPLRDDRYGIVQAWVGGGYSDDLIVAAKCAEHQLQVLCQPHAVFPQRLDPCFTWRRYWNYLRRQLFVMDTWAGGTNRRINHTMMAAHSYLSWAFTVPATTASLRLLLWVVQLLLLPTQQVYDGPGTSWDWLGLFGEKGCSLSVVSTLLFWVGLLGAAGALRWMTGVLLDLFAQQLPAADDLDLQCFSWGKLWLGMYVNNALLPLCMLYTYLQPAIEWAGITYWKRNGSITYIQHTSAYQCRPGRRDLVSKTGASDSSMLRSMHVRCAAQTAPSSEALKAGNNPIGQVIKDVYGIGGPTTIRWGVLKRSVEGPVQNGRKLSFEEYRKQTEPERQQLREQFAERLEVISYPERKRRAIVGACLAVPTLTAAAWMVANDASTVTRLTLVPTLFFSLGFLVSAQLGLCTESLAGAWDVDDRGLEPMLSLDVAKRIQKKVFSMYIGSTVLSVLAMVTICKL